MYNHDGQNLFVIDGHMHFWDANPENWKNKYGESWIKCFHAFHSGLSPAEEQLMLSGNGSVLLGIGPDE